MIQVFKKTINKLLKNEYNRLKSSFHTSVHQASSIDQYSLKQRKTLWAFWKNKVATTIPSACIVIQKIQKQVRALLNYHVL